MTLLMGLIDSIKNAMFQNDLRSFDLELKVDLHIFDFVVDNEETH